MIRHQAARWVGLFLLVAKAAVGAEPGFTYNWTVETSESFSPASAGTACFASDANLLYFDPYYIEVYDRSLNHIRQLESSDCMRLLVDTNRVYYLRHNDYDADLTAYRPSDFAVLWKTKAFGFPRGMSMDDACLYVADYNLNTITVCDKADGTVVRSWGGAGNLPEQFNKPQDVAVADDLLYVCDTGHNLVKLFAKDGSFVRSFPVATPTKVSACGDFVYVGASNGLLVYDRNDNLLWRSATQEGLANCNIYFDQGDVYVRTTAPRFLRLTGPTYRTLGLKDFNALPIPVVTNVVQRRGTSVLDIDYVVRDADDTHVVAYATAFRVPSSGAFVPSLTNLIPVCTFVDGTATSVGTNIAVDANHRLSWDMQADGILSVIPDYGDIKVAVLSRDRRDRLLDLQWLQIPAMDGNPALTINRAPLQQADFLPVWFWLLASGDAAVNLNTGSVCGVGGTYNGQVLAVGTNTTESGRAFLFERLNAREATPQEVQLAREAGTPGTVQKWIPLRTPPSNGAKVNAIGFVTDPTNGWWVVPLSP